MHRQLISRATTWIVEYIAYDRKPRIEALAGFFVCWCITPSCIFTSTTFLPSLKEAVPVSWRQFSGSGVDFAFARPSYTCARVCACNYVQYISWSTLTPTWELKGCCSLSCNQQSISQNLSLSYHICIMVRRPTLFDCTRFISSNL
jgi:hypothetical protein